MKYLWLTLVLLVALGMYYQPTVVVQIQRDQIQGIERHMLSHLALVVSV